MSLSCVRRRTVTKHMTAVVHRCTGGGFLTVPADPMDVREQHGVASDSFRVELVAPLAAGRRGDPHTMLAEHRTDRLHTPSHPVVALMVGVLTDEVS